MNDEFLLLAFQFIVVAVIIGAGVMSVTPWRQGTRAPEHGAEREAFGTGNAQTNPLFAGWGCNIHTDIVNDRSL